ncbi:MAG TPA: nuclear transport factor 2 family protein [Terriglobia bacterium]|nr:nuclear transport factor 2 family protein [Terriglobia bacterium]
MLRYAGRDRYAAAVHIPVRMKKTLFGLLLVGCVGSAAFVLSTCDGSVEQQEPGLTVADYVEIQQLVNRLNFALDYCGNGGRDFADLFVDGGRFVIDRGDGMPAVRDTREALITLAGGPDCESRRTPPSAYILHLAESLVIEPDRGSARGKSYAIYPANHGRYFNAETAGQLGIYYDEYVRTPSGWRFRSRRHVIDPVAGTVTQ